jgi:ribose-phosphate pyrophosphokinase
MASEADREDLALFALGSSRRFGEGVARALGVELAEHELRAFEDGEHKARPLASVRGADAFVIHSLHGEPGSSVNDKLCELMFFVSCLLDAGAGRVTAVIPYLCYARKDRKTKPRDPVTSRYVIELLEASGTDRLLAFEVHNPAAFQNAARDGADHLEARHLLVPRLAELVGDGDAVVVSPDAGGFKRADRARQDLEARLERSLPIAFLQKRRSAGVVEGDEVIGDVRGKRAIVIDDLISSGGTLARAARALAREGARSVVAAVAHGLFSGPASEVLAEPALERILVTSSVPPRGLEGSAAEKLEVLRAEPMFADAIERLYLGRSLTSLLEG